MTFADGSLVIEPLARHHDRSSFRCGNSVLDAYLRDMAGQDTRRNTARVFVAQPKADQARVLGYYSLSAAQVAASAFPAGMRLPRYPIPAALIGRLAVDQQIAGRGLGAILLADAVKRAMIASHSLGIAVIVVDPVDSHAAGYYQRFGFTPLGEAGGRMFRVLDARRDAP